VQIDLPSVALDQADFRATVASYLQARALSRFRFCDASDAVFHAVTHTAHDARWTPPASWWRA
jgi:hypothetical protein